MSTQMKLIIPLLDKNIKKEYLTAEAGFVNAYSWDKNRPYIDNCIFLVYTTPPETEIAKERAFVFSGLKSLYKIYYIRSKGKAYIVYAIVIIDSDIKCFLKGHRHTKQKTFSRILQFWSGSDLQVLKYLNKNLTAYTCTGESVPEEDINPTINEYKQTKDPQGLVINRGG